MYGLYLCIKPYHCDAPVLRVRRIFPLYSTTSTTTVLRSRLFQRLLDVPYIEYLTRTCRIENLQVDFCVQRRTTHAAVALCVI